MAILEIVKYESESDVKLNLAICKDERLSLKAKGIWLHLMSKQENCIFHKDEIKEKSADGTKGINNGFDELIKFGYVHRYMAKKENGEINWIFRCFDEPQEEIKSK